MDLYSGQPFSLFFADGTEIAATWCRFNSDEPFGFFTDDGTRVDLVKEGKGVFAFGDTGRVLTLEPLLGKSPK